MGNFFTNVQGRPDDAGFRLLRRRILWNQTGFNAAAGIPIGAVEKGGVIVRAYAIKNTAFSGGATLTLGNAANLGAASVPANAPAGSFYATNPAVAAQAPIQAAANPASVMATGDTAATTAGLAMVGNNTSPGGPLVGQELVADAVLYAYLGGTAATAGDVTFIVEYAPAYPWSDLFGGQAS